MSTEAARLKRRLLPRVAPLASWVHMDMILLAATAALTVCGIALIYSATRGIDPESYSRFYLQRQSLFAIVGGLAAMVAAIVDYRRLRLLVWPLYGVTLLVLVLVLTPLGAVRQGARAWFVLGGYQVQPSEFAKLSIIVVLAHYAARCGGRMSLRQLVAALALVAAPALLILREPDAGTAVVFAVIAMGVLLVAGAQVRHIVAATVLGLAGLGLVLSSDLVREYQRQRIASIVDPGGNPGDTFNLEQAQIAVGNGGLTGQGYGRGTQTRSGLVPSQETDFVFTVLGEELGFLGSVAVLGLFAVLLWRIWRSARVAGDLFGSLLSTGVLCMILFQVFQTVGMAAGIMPVIGIPLPLLSYGGSSLLTTLMSLGLVLNVSMRRHLVRAS
ncbi:MAG: rod shape-determining protein RodA [bacterium]|nr:rod shape-determining protein RodA [bacterium]MCY3925798.1 rod shape-determining protein RodA [bacterium]